MRGHPVATAATAREFGVGGMLLPVLWVGAFLLPAALWGSQLRGSGDANGIGWAKLLIDTGLVAGGGALFATILGVPLALVCNCYRAREFPLWQRLLLLPLLFPTTVVTAAVQGFFLPLLPALTVGLDASVLIVGIQGMPLVFLGVRLALLSIPEAERHSWQLLARPVRWRVMLGRLRSPAVLALLLVFLLNVPRMEVTGFTGVPYVLGSQWLAAITGVSEEGRGWLLAGGCLLLALPALITFARLLNARAPMTTLSQWPSTAAPWGWRIAVGSLVLVGVAGLLRVFLDAGTLPWPGARRWIGVGHPLDGGLLPELLRGVVLSGFLVFAGWNLARATRWPRLWGVLLSIPLFLPENVPALVLLRGWGWQPSGMWGDMPLLLTLAQGIRFGGIGYLLGLWALNSIPESERQMAQWLTRRQQRQLLWRRSCNTLALGLILLTILILGEVECAILLAPPGYDVPAKVLNDFLHYRYDADAARLSVGMAAAIGLLAGLLAWGRRTAPRKP